MILVTWRWSTGNHDESVRNGAANRLPTLQIYECSECLHHFTTGAAGKNKSYPLKTILEAVSMFNLAGYVHILDYKPEARKEKHAHVQLTIYALALARSTGLKLKDFKCAWFDEKDYFEFHSRPCIGPEVCGRWSR